MLSPLEYDPELIAGIGLITARWAALERQLAELLGTVMKAKTAGPNSYYAIGNFTQRIDLVQAAVVSTLTNAKHRKITTALFTKIRRIWKTRNYLVHSHYVYIAQYEDGTHSGLIAVGKGPLKGKPLSLRAKAFIGPVGGPMTELTKPRLIQEGFAYSKRDNGRVTYHFVNKGTFANHAEQLRKRGWQVTLLARAIDVGRTPIPKAKPEPSRKKSPSRSRPHPQ